MRLVDADKCPCNECAKFCDKNCCDAFVEWRKGCDYDIDKVVEQLECEKETIAILKDMHHDNSLGDMYCDGQTRAFEYAIDVVKEGGAE